jgi:hypothetical protein
MNDIAALSHPHSPQGDSRTTEGAILYGRPAAPLALRPHSLHPVPCL